MIWLSAIIYAAINRFVGSNRGPYGIFASKAAIYTYSGLIALALSILSGNGWLMSIILSIIVSIGYWTYRQPAIGRGFMLSHGWRQNKHHLRPLDLLVSRWLDVWPQDVLHPAPPAAIKGGKLYGLVWMTLRGLLMIPLFFALGFFDTTIWLMIPLILLHGIFYFISNFITNKQYIIQGGEILNGLLIGTAIGLAIV